MSNIDKFFFVEACNHALACGRDSYIAKSSCALYDERLKVKKTLRTHIEKQTQ